MILLLGATGFVGQVFARELRQRQSPFVSPTRRELDYTRFEALIHYLRKTKPDFLINAAGYSGKPNVDACETAKSETLLGNSLFPQMIACACAETVTPWGHISSGCIYTGAKVVQNGVPQVEKDLNRPEIRRLFDEHPENFKGFTEADDPNFCFRQPPCSFYSGTKALAEEAICGIGQNYIWRLRIPFDEFDGPRNFLSKIQRYPKVYDNVNSLSHLGDFVGACLDLWEKRAPFGIYNVTNPGAVTTRQVIEAIQRVLKPERRFEFWQDDAEFYALPGRTPRSNCILDVSKLLATGVKLRPVEEALMISLKSWQPAAAATKHPGS